MNRKTKPFRHSSSFYRKVSKLCKLSEPGDNVNPRENSTEVASSCSSSNIQHQSGDVLLNPSCDDRGVVQSNSTDDFRLDVTSSSSENNSHDESNEPSESETNETNSLNFKQKLQHWALQHQIPHNALNSLLNILREDQRNSFLPKDSRTLLQTPRTNDIITFGGGQYWYNGIEKSLKDVFSEYSEELPTEISLTFNMDGLPIAKSAKKEFWPILCKLSGIKNIPPLVVAIYYGDTKPPVEDFLRQFVNELQNLLIEGISIHRHRIAIKIRCFVCDTPARCFIKGTVGFNSYHGCMKCTVIGEFDRRGRHMSFPRTNMALRTDHSFRSRLDPDHHRNRTPIEDLPINLVEDFVIADSLHLLDLGVMKRCLCGWVKGSFNFRTKWSVNDIQAVSGEMMEIKLTTPFEVHQGRIRQLDTIHFWKATEFKNFLLYYGPVILKHNLSQEVYQHYLLLFCATTICCSDIYKSYLPIAKTLYEKYVEKFIDIYGTDSVSSNVHNLSHIVNDVLKFGPLPTISAYPFESMLFRIKNLLRKGELPLAQVANRLQELTKLPQNNTKELYPSVKNQTPLPTGEIVFSTVFLKENCKLSLNDKDKWFLTTDSHIIQMEYAKSEGKIKIAGKKIKSTFNFFERPLKSSYLNIFATLRNYDMEGLQFYSVDKVKCKLLSLRTNCEIVYIPILSTM